MEKYSNTPLYESHLSKNNNTVFILFSSTVELLELEMDLSFWIRRNIEFEYLVSRSILFSFFFFLKKELKFLTNFRFLYCLKTKIHWLIEI